ncbi:MAG: hypothetical protein LUG44_07005, partial [Clostridiales bacterium]|nr:hypothetical protein [Clostridiales bacterium]
NPSATAYGGGPPPLSGEARGESACRLFFVFPNRVQVFSQNGELAFLSSLLGICKERFCSMLYNLSLERYPSATDHPSRRPCEALAEWPISLAGSYGR